MSASLVAVLVAVVAAGALAARLLAERERVARAVHELRGPLAAAGLAVEAMAARGALAPGAAEGITAQLRRAGLALRDLERPGRPPDTIETVRLSVLMANLAHAWQPVAAARGRRLEVVPARAGTAVLGDRTRLAQAVGNLIANALEHGAGDVHVRARVTGERVRIEVADEGPGIGRPLDLRGPRTGRGARGRGLAIAAGIAARHGGRLTTGPSPHGPALALELPVAAGATAAAEAAR